MKYLLLIGILFFNSYGFGASLSDLNDQAYPFKLPALGFENNALEPYFDAQTMALHHGKHHQGYVNNLNKALADQKKPLSLVEVLNQTEKFSPAVRNNAGGHWNHAFFWTVLTPPAKKSKLSKSLKARIKKDFGSMKHMQQEFQEAGKSVFGSGWVWLIKITDGSLKIVTTHNQDNPLMDIAPVKGTPILGLDVWEHAYYLKYQNMRGSYLEAFWHIVNWDQVSQYYKEK